MPQGGGGELISWTESIWDDLEANSHYPVDGDEEQDLYHGKQNVAPEVVAALKEIKANIQIVADTQ